MSLFGSYLLLGIAALLPVFASMLFFVIEKYSKFDKLNYWIKQVIFGVAFGALAVVGTEWGIPMNSAQVNCRDAAVLTAGLFFGWPAGLIAGVIGGVERWLAGVYWGVAPATKIACSVSTVIAGVYAALLRKFIFKEERPNLIIAFFAGLVMETFHLLMVFLTNLNNTSFAYRVVNACTLPMVLFNALSVLISALFFDIVEKRSLKIRKIKSQKVSTTVQVSLLITCVIAFILTTAIVTSVEVNMSTTSASSLLSQTLSDLDKDILNTSNSMLSPLAYKAANEAAVNERYVENIAAAYKAVDINIVDKNGICKYSVDKSFLEVDFNKREDTQEFVRLIDTESSYFQYQRYQAVPGTTKYRKYIGIKTTVNDKWGFIRIGFNDETIKSYISSSISLFALNRHVGTMDSSFVIIADSDLKVVSKTESLSQDDARKQIVNLHNTKDYTTVKSQVNEKESFAQRASSESYMLITTLGVDASRQSMYTDLYLFSFLQIIAYTILFTLVYVLIDRIILRGFNKVTTSLEKISSGDLDVNVDVSSSIEFTHLSNNINTTVETLKGYIDEANQRIDKELKLAKDIQSSSLPRVTKEFKDHPCFDINACMFTAKEVGGDFYDFYYNSKHRLTFAVADVSGKGIPASLFMMRSKQELKSLTEAGLPIDEVFTNSNKSLCEGNDAGMFVTVWQGCIDLRTGDINFANAGHNAPLVYRAATGKFEYISCIKGFVMAGLDIMKYKKQELHLDEGDIIFLYTDGVTEATNSEKQLYGDNRLLDVLNSQEFTSMEELCRVVKYDVDQFVGEAPQFDDITMLAFRFVKKAEPKVK